MFLKANYKAFQYATAEDWFHKFLGAEVGCYEAKIQ